MVDFFLRTRRVGRAAPLLPRLLTWESPKDSALPSLDPLLEWLLPLLRSRSSSWVMMRSLEASLGGSCS